MFKTISLTSGILTSGILLILIGISMLYFGLVDSYVRPGITFYSPLTDEPVGAPGKAPTHWTTKTVYSPGETVYAKVNFFKDRDIEARIKWNLSDTFIRPYQTRPGNLTSVSHHSSKIVPIERLPLDLVPGEYFFVGMATYRINFLVDKSYHMKTNKFTVR
jgi:hypothetical protein